MIVVLTEDRSEVTYTAQRTLLANSSPWFAKALDVRFREGRNCTLHLPEESSEVVEHFLYWLFNGTLALSDNVDSAQVDVVHHAQLLATRLWIFGDKHFLPRLQNQAMKLLHRLLQLAFPTISMIAEAYNNSPPESGLRKIMLGEVMMGYFNMYLPGERFNTRDLQCQECRVIAVDAVELQCCSRRLCKGCAERDLEAGACSDCRVEVLGNTDYWPLFRSRREAAAFKATEDKCRNGGYEIEQLEPLRHSTDFFVDYLETLTRVMQGDSKKTWDGSPVEVYFVAEEMTTAS